MANSMTAFSRVERGSEDIRLIWEVRSVNHRYLDISLKLPDELKLIDAQCRGLINGKLNRGRIDVFLKIDRSTRAGDPAGFDRELAVRVASALKQIGEIAPELQTASAMDVLRWPGVIQEDRGDSDTLLESALEGLENALEILSENRAREGQRMTEVILEKSQRCREITRALLDDFPQIQAKVRQKWEKKVEELIARVDADRLAQEIALILTKSDINEELDRLLNHLDETDKLLEKTKPVGRSLDFLMQELNREANTLGSKSVDDAMTNASIELKVLIDQMREQVQNLE